MAIWHTFVFVSQRTDNKLNILYKNNNITSLFLYNNRLPHMLGHHNKCIVYFEGIIINSISFFFLPIVLVVVIHCVYKTKKTASTIVLNPGHNTICFCCQFEDGCQVLWYRCNENFVTRDAHLSTQCVQITARARHSWASHPQRDKPLGNKLEAGKWEKWGSGAAYGCSGLLSSANCSL